MKKTFYTYVQTYRGGAWSDPETHFAEACFHDPSFPKQATTFDEISRYIEMHGNDELSITTFDLLWQSYEEKYA